MSCRVVSYLVLSCLVSSCLLRQVLLAPLRSTRWEQLTFWRYGDKKIDVNFFYWCRFLYFLFRFRFFCCLLSLFVFVCFVSLIPSVSLSLSRFEFLFGFVLRLGISACLLSFEFLDIPVRGSYTGIFVAKAFLQDPPPPFPFPLSPSPCGLTFLTPTLTVTLHSP